VPITKAHAYLLDCATRGDEANFDECADGSALSGAEGDMRHRWMDRDDLGAIDVSGVMRNRRSQD